MRGPITTLLSIDLRLWVPARARFTRLAGTTAMSATRAVSFSRRRSSEVWRQPTLGGPRGWGTAWRHIVIRLGSTSLGSARLGAGALRLAAPHRGFFLPTPGPAFSGEPDHPALKVSQLLAGDHLVSPGGAPSPPQCRVYETLPGGAAPRPAQMTSHENALGWMGYRNISLYKGIKSIAPTVGWAKAQSAVPTRLFSMRQDGGFRCAQPPYERTLRAYSPNEPDTCRMSPPQSLGSNPCST
jgi:hypothetical protein